MPDPATYQHFKAFIGGSRFLVGSRFHRLVAALSQDVPVVALGWAHKYPRLLDDFDVSEFNLVGIDGENAASSLIQSLIDESSYNDVKQRIVSAREKLQTLNVAMWEEVFSTLAID